MNLVIRVDGPRCSSPRQTLGIVAAEALNAVWMTWLLVVASRMPKLASRFASTVSVSCAGEISACRTQPNQRSAVAHDERRRSLYCRDVCRAFRHGSSLKILFSGERSARLVVARGWDTLPAQSDEYVLNDINSGLPAVHVHLSVLLSPFDPRVFGHNDIAFTSRAGRASQYPLSWRGRSNS